jgi:hypothetical protein
MKRALFVIVPVVILGGALALLWTAYHRHATKIVFHWNYTNSAGFVDCSASVKKKCMTGFTLTDLTAAQVVTRNIGPDDRSYTYILPSPARPGYEHRFSLVANGLDSTGMPVDSLPNLVTIRYSFWSAVRGKPPGPP